MKCLVYFRRSSLCKNVNVSESGDAPEKDKGPALKTDSSAPGPGTSSTASTLPTENATPEDDRTTVKSVSGRKK